MTPQEFTETAIRLARERASMPEQVIYSITTSTDRCYDVTLSEPQWGVVLELIHNKIRQYKAIIKKTMDYPSDTISSEITRRKYNDKIQDLEEIIAAITEEAN